MYIASIMICMLILCIALVQPPQDQSVCEGGTASFACVILFPNGTTPGNPTWLDENGNDIRSNYDVSDEVDGQTVTSILTVTNVSFSDDEDSFLCVRVGSPRSNVSFLYVLGKCLCTNA